MPRRFLTIALAAMLSLGCQAQDRRYHGDGIDNYLQYTPILMSFALRCFGFESENEWDRKLVNSFTTLAIRLGATYALKASINSTRPDGTDRNSFPSGHTVVVFVGATTLHREFGKEYPWVSVVGYSIATLTAIDRIRRNRHRWCDVVAGAAIGMAASEAGYRIGGLIMGGKDRKRKKDLDLDLCFEGDAVSVVLNL